MRLQDFSSKVRKSLGLVRPGELRESGRFNLALLLLNDADKIGAESRSMVEKLKSADVSSSMIQNN